MRHQLQHTARRSVSRLIALLAMGLSPAVATAGLSVTKAGGSFEFGPSDIIVVPSSHAFTANVPGTGTATFSGTAGGSGRVDYALARPGGGLTANIAASVDSFSNDGGPAVDAATRFSQEFVNDRPLRYRFTATPDQGPLAFTATLDSIVASASYNSLGEASGTVPFDENGEFGQFVREGILPAGTHQFTLAVFGAEAKNGGRGSAGSATLAVTAVPLPSAAWTGLIGLAALGATRGARRWRAAVAARD